MNRILKEYSYLISDEKANRFKHEYEITDFLVYNIRDELYVSDSLGRIFAIKLGDGEIAETHCFLQIPIRTIAFSPNQSYLAISYASGSVQLVSSQSFVIEMNLLDHQYDPRAASKPLSLVVLKENLSRMKEVFLLLLGSAVQR